eukprot:CAMPEP_0202977942 /NCGR_PEP_ID=MMETSP1396-20130829/84543_1 /ASSEMBLY_ACC=CAM_ASM_000872 /TAXON_ID= /ORGANISM="Pseudokeronopsis sp., Strain Brazil" /LENGTH=116 /DNA_ID=CAMNT_0049716773 /DNA_START=361 /DNA_END=711 /DNA_ORIENTATION=+
MKISLSYTLAWTPTSRPVESTFGTFFGAVGDYKVLDTDYENFTIVYSCVDSHIKTSGVNLWILSRTPELAEEHLKHALDVIEAQLPEYQQEWLYFGVQGETCNYEGAVPDSSVVSQ